MYPSHVLLIMRVCIVGGHSRCTPRRRRARRTATDIATQPSLLTTFGTLSPATLYSCGLSGQQMSMPSAAEFEQAGPTEIPRVQNLSGWAKANLERKPR